MSWFKEYLRELRAQEQSELSRWKTEQQSPYWDSPALELPEEICPECNRAATFTPKYLTPSIQMRMFDSGEEAWLECDLCGAKLDARDILESVERKSAGRVEVEREERKRA
jgi:hypothetical protein